MWVLVDELLARANASTSPDELLGILQELQFRSTKRSREVRLLILNRRARLIEESFKWPTTAAPGGSGALAEETVFQNPQGVLGYLGYQVGRAGRLPESRKEILDWVYKNPLPFVNSAAYMGEWGQPISGPRLRKTAESIAAFCRNAKRNDPSRRGVAITDWEDDLAYLKRTYYDGRYDFVWPRTDP